MVREGRQVSDRGLDTILRVSGLVCAGLPRGGGRRVSCYNEEEGLVLMRYAGFVK